MFMQKAGKRPSGVYHTGAALLTVAAVAVGLAGAVVMESPVMRHGIEPEEVLGTGRNFWRFTEKADLQALRRILEENSPEFTPATASLR